jgi:hypothetical protein
MAKMGQRQLSMDTAFDPNTRLFLRVLVLLGRFCVFVHTEEKVSNDRLKLPPDMANGLILTLLKNLRSCVC